MHSASAPSPTHIAGGMGTVAEEEPPAEKEGEEAEPTAAHGLNEEKPEAPEPDLQVTV